MAELDQAAAPVHAADLGIIRHPCLPTFLSYFRRRIEAVRHVRQGHGVQHFIAAPLHLQQLLFLGVLLGRIDHNFARVLPFGQLFVAWAAEKKRRRATQHRTQFRGEDAKERAALDRAWHNNYDKPESIRDDE